MTEPRPREASKHNYRWPLNAALSQPGQIYNPGQITLQKIDPQPWNFYGQFFTSALLIFLLQLAVSYVLGVAIYSNDTPFLFKLFWLTK